MSQRKMWQKTLAPIMVSTILLGAVHPVAGAAEGETEGAGNDNNTSADVTPGGETGKPGGEGADKPEPGKDGKTPGTEGEKPGTEGEKPGTEGEKPGEGGETTDPNTNPEGGENSPSGENGQGNGFKKIDYNETDPKDMKSGFEKGQFEPTGGAPITVGVTISGEGRANIPVSLAANGVEAGSSVTDGRGRVEFTTPQFDYGKGNPDISIKVPEGYKFGAPRCTAVGGYDEAKSKEKTIQAQEEALEYNKSMEGKLREAFEKKEDQNEEQHNIKMLKIKARSDLFGDTAKTYDKYDRNLALSYAGQLGWLEPKKEFPDEYKIGYTEAEETPAEGENTKPAEGENTKPAEGENTKPAEGENTKPAEGENTKPAEGDKDKKDTEKTGKKKGRIDTSVKDAGKVDWKKIVTDLKAKKLKLGDAKADDKFNKDNVATWFKITDKTKESTFNKAMDDFAKHIFMSNIEPFQSPIPWDVFAEALRSTSLGFPSMPSEIPAPDGGSIGRKSWEEGYVIYKNGGQMGQLFGGFDLSSDNLKVKTTMKRINIAQNSHDPNKYLELLDYLKQVSFPAAYNAVDKESKGGVSAAAKIIGDLTGGVGQMGSILQNIPVIGQQAGAITGGLNILSKMTEGIDQAVRDRKGGVAVKFMVMVYNVIKWLEEKLGIGNPDLEAYHRKQFQALNDVKLKPVPLFAVAGFDKQNVPSGADQNFLSFETSPGAKVECNVPLIKEGDDAKDKDRDRNRNRQNPAVTGPAGSVNFPEIDYEALGKALGDRSVTVNNAPNGGANTPGTKSGQNAANQPRGVRNTVPAAQSGYGPKVNTGGEREFSLMDLVEEFVERNSRDIFA